MDSLKREGRPDAWDESVSTGCLSNPTMNARDTANAMYINYTLNKSFKWYKVYICRVLQKGFIADEFYP